MTNTLVFLQLGRLVPSPYNRKHLGPLDELAASIHQVGVIEPLIVRKMRATEVAVLNGNSQTGMFEIVAGERRWRAAELAELVDVPCIVRELTDEQAIEVMLIENCQRVDAHPVDEANAYSTLIERGHTVAAIAGRVGRSPAHVAQRLRLLDAIPEVLAALDEDRITIGVALVLSRVPQKLQKDALERVLEPFRYEGGMPTVKQAQELARENYMLRLAEAPFDKADAELAKDRPACTACPDRTGNQAELFSDVDSPDLCTNPICYRAKLDAHWLVLKRQARKDKRPVMSDKDAKSTFHAYDEHPNYSAGYVRLDDKVLAGNKQRSVKSLVGKDVETTLARNPHTGHIHELVERKVVDAAKRQLEREKRSKAKDGGQPDYAAEQKETAAVERETNERAIAHVLGKVEELPDSEAAIELLVKAVIAMSRFDGMQGLAKRRGLLDENKRPPTERELAHLIADKPLAERVSVAAELALRYHPMHDYLFEPPDPDFEDPIEDGLPPQWQAAIDDWGLDWPALHKAVTKEREAARKAKEKKAAAKGDGKAKADKPAKPVKTSVHFAPSGTNVCGTKPGTSTGYGATNSPENVTCPACRELVAKSKKAAPAPAKKARVRKKRPSKRRAGAEA